MNHLANTSSNTILLDMAEPAEMSEEYILKTYALSKRKEHAFVDSLSDEKIRIFCGKDEYSTAK